MPKLCRCFEIQIKFKNPPPNNYYTFLTPNPPPVTQNQTNGRFYNLFMKYLMHEVGI